MTQRYGLTAAAAVLLASTIGFAQTPAPNPSPQPQSQPTRPGEDPQTMGRETSEVSKTATVTLVGCLQREQDVPGKEPNVAERAGIGEDFILTNASPKGEDTESKDSQEAVGTSGTIASTGAQKMFKIEGLDDEQLRDYIGKRVEVTGRLDDDAASPEVGTSGKAEGSGQYEKPNRDKLPKIDAASIRPAAGNCPAGR